MTTVALLCGFRKRVCVCVLYRLNVSMWDAPMTHDWLSDQTSDIWSDGNQVTGYTTQILYDFTIMTRWPESWCRVKEVWGGPYELMFLWSLTSRAWRIWRRELEDCLPFSAYVRAQLIDIRMEASDCNVVSLPHSNPLQMWWKGPGSRRRLCMCRDYKAKTSLAYLLNQSSLFYS